jgi:ribose 5-phosphate isomerase A
MNRAEMPMNQDSRKEQAARAALEFIKPGMALGVGTGSTVNFLIDALDRFRGDLAAVVASSRATEARLRARGFTVVELDQAGDLDLYVDGADEANKHFHLVKGGGGALTREKILAAASRRFVCIIDSSKWVATLGKFPLPVEVIPMARSCENFVTDNGKHILDVHNLQITNPPELESRLNQIPGIVTVGLFANRPADIILMAEDGGVKRMDRR